MEEKLYNKYNVKIKNLTKLKEDLNDGFIHYYYLNEYNDIVIYSWHLKDKDWYILKKNLDIIKEIRTQILSDSYEMLGVKLNVKEKKYVYKNKEKNKSKYKRNRLNE